MYGELNNFLGIWDEEEQNKRTLDILDERRSFDSYFTWFQVLPSSVEGPPKQ